jgi:hypothetical protein
MACGGYHHVNASVWMRSAVAAGNNFEGVEVGWWDGNALSTSPGGYIGSYQGWYESDFNQYGLWWTGNYNSNAPPNAGSLNRLRIVYDGYYSNQNHWKASIDNTLMQTAVQTASQDEAVMAGVEEQSGSGSNCGPGVWPSANWTPTIHISSLQRVDRADWYGSGSYTWENWADGVNPCTITFANSASPGYETFEEGNYGGDFYASIGPLAGPGLPKPPSAPWTVGTTKPFYPCPGAWK